MSACRSCRIASPPSPLRDGLCGECWTLEFVSPVAPNRNAGVPDALAKAFVDPRSSLSAFDIDRSTADLRWLWTEAESAMGLRSPNPGAVPECETTQRRVDDRGDAAGVAMTVTGFVQRTAMAYEPTDRELAAARRMNRIMRTLATLPHRTVRILQRRYDQHYYPHLDVLFGEWSGIVDYLTDLNEQLNPRDGKKAALGKGTIAKWITKAKSEAEAATTEYIVADRALHLEDRAARARRLMVIK